MGKLEKGIDLSMTLIRMLTIGNLDMSLQIVQCIHVDALGESFEQENAFMLALPFIQCTTALARRIQNITYIGLAMMVSGVPFFVGFLISKLWVASAKFCDQAVNIEFKKMPGNRFEVVLSQVLPCIDVPRACHSTNYNLCASAAACVAVMAKYLKCRTVSIEMNQNSIRLSLESCTNEFNFETIVGHYSRLECIMQKRNAWDRAALHSPTVAGARSYFSKYASNSLIVMDLFLKFTNLGIVALVDMENSLPHIICICCLTTIAVATLQPFVKPTQGHMVMLRYSCIGVVATAFEWSDQVWENLDPFLLRTAVNSAGNTIV